jgi:hypothetical protein
VEKPQTISGNDHIQLGPSSTEMMAIDRLRPLGRNARSHSIKQVRQIAKSIERQILNDFLSFTIETFGMNDVSISHLKVHG